jgi:hypothetical protein
MYMPEGEEKWRRNLETAHRELLKARLQFRASMPRMLCKMLLDNI